MNREEMRFYTERIVDWERHKHNSDPASPCRWPGKKKKSNAFSRYPNIVAFMRCAIGPYITTAAEIAGISPDEMAAVIEDDRELNQQQLSRLAYQWNCPVKCLETPSLLMVDPSTILGMGKVRHLEMLAEQTHELEIIPNEWVEPILAQLRKEEPVTYAGYMFCIRVLTYAKRHPVKKKDCVQVGHNRKEKRRCLIELK